jgi:hypothetical protein
LKHLVVDPLVEVEPGCVCPGGRSGIRRVHVGLPEERAMLVHNPLRLAESPWVAIVGRHPWLWYVEAEIAYDIYQQTGAATAGTGHKQ